MNETMTKGRRLKIGLHAWNAMDCENVATIYGVDNQTVAKCREEARGLHERMRDKSGFRYWSNLGMARLPEINMPMFNIGPTLREHEAAELEKRKRGL